MSSISSSAVNQITLPCGVLPSLQGHSLTGGDAGDHVAADQTLALVRQAADQAKLAECKPVGP